MAYRQWQRLHGTRDPGLRDHSQSRPLLHSHSKPGIEWHLRELRQNLQARLCSREPSSGCDHRTPADRRMVLGLQRKPSPFWAQNALPKGVHASSITIALCPVKRGQLHADILSREQGADPPDCEATLDGRPSGVEVTELTHRQALERNLRQPDSPEYFDWDNPTFLGALKKCIDAKDRAW